MKALIAYASWLGHNRAIARALASELSRQGVAVVCAPVSRVNIQDLARFDLLVLGTYTAGIYGGYFGAAQGVILMGLMSALSSEPIQRLNGYKNVLSLIVNFVAATVFVLFARDHIDWLIVVLIAVGSFVGGIIGAHVGRRIPPNVLRALILLIGIVAIVKLVWFP